MRRKSSAAIDRPESPTELIARITAEYDSQIETTGRHRIPNGAGAAVVTRDAPPKRSSTRRLAPLAVGAAVMLIATVVATAVQPSEPEVGSPELAALGQVDPAPAASPPMLANTPANTPAATPAPPADATAAAPPAAGAAAAPKPSTQPQRNQASPPAAAPKPQTPPPAAAASGGDGAQAAASHGWTPAGGDEFNGSKSPNWGVYEGAGHAGNGKRTASAITVENGSLVIRGDSAGNTGGMSWKTEQRFGKWEMRAKFPKGDKQYHPVLILWPDGPWPQGGEVDFAETDSAASDVSFFLHYSASNQQKYAKKTIDITQWHNYAVEWVDNRITGYIDGVKWFESTDPATMPPGQMHPTIQLDYFPEGGNPKPSEMYVDYMRIYK